MEGEKLSGPYRATKLWNEAILTFREGMPLKKHRHHMKMYEDCFTGTEAVSWLHKALKENPNFDTVVTREQIVQLLHKFLRSSVFCKVGDKCSNTLDQFKDNNNVYKFCDRSPLKNLQLSNLVPRDCRLKMPSIPKLDSSPKVVRVPEIDNMLEKKRFLEEVKTKAICKQRSHLEVGEVWKSVVLGRLEALMQGVNIEKIIPPENVNGYWIAENAETAKSLQQETLTRQLEGARGFPNWILSAMKTVMSWPQQVQGTINQSGYAGFEKDVFKEVEKYFNDNETPLIPVTYAKAFSEAVIYFDHKTEPDTNISEEIHESQIDTVYPLSSKSVENLVLGMSSPLRSATNPFIQQDVTQYEELQDECTNPFAEYINTPLCQSFYTQAMSSVNNPLHHHSQPLYQSCPSDQILSGSKILTTVLPPNSCFETAFTSESPTTRIIPQCTVDTLHFQRRQRARLGQRELIFNSPESPIYVRMDKCSNEKKVHSKKNIKNEPRLRKRNTADGTVYSFQTSLSYEISTLSEKSGKRSSGGYMSGQHVTANHGSRMSGDCSSRDYMSGECAPTHYGSEFISEHSSREGERQLGDRVSVDRYFSMNPHSKHHSLNAALIDQPQSVPPTLASNDQDEVRPVLPPKPLKSGNKGNVILKKSEDMKNQSGGYVNLALSYDDANYNENIDLQQLDVDSAMASLFSLMKCSQSVNPPTHSTPVHDDSSAISPTFSLSSISSYQTNTVENTPAPIDTSENFICDSFMRRKPTLKLQEKFPGEMSVQGKKIAIEVMQLLLLIIPPENRKKLSLLIHFMVSVDSNSQLCLSEEVPNKLVLLQAFKSCILTLEKDEASGGDNKEEELKICLLNFLMTEVESLMYIPRDMYEEVQQHITEFEQEQMKGSQASQQQHQFHVASGRQSQFHEDCKATETEVRHSISQPALTYCEQVTQQQFEQQKFTGSQRALYELLEQIVNDPKMALKEKQNRLKTFKQSYPHIYNKRFPTKEEEDKVLAPKTKGLLRFASLSRLKNLRL